VLFGLRSVSTTLAREVNVVFEPPKVSVVSTHHYINHGGSELVVYRATPPDVESGVLVGDRFYPGYPIPGEAGAKDPSIRVAFFALLYDQDLGTAIDVLARDAAGNEAKAEFEHRVFAKKFRKSRLELDEAFLSRVVPPILERSPELGAVEAAEGDLLTPFLKVNGELRRQNAEKAATFAAMTAPEMLWEGAFSALGGAQVESSFADYRTYVYQGKEVDRQVHLGADLASTANAPVRAANRGKVVFTGYLGIYGECVVLDHGMGLQSMYAHLSSTAVAVGDVVSRNQEIGRTGTTGLAGGDHLHFAVLLQGHEVAPAEWWDPHWIEDRVIRKLKSVAP
jgi:murein DD-endopeptidase MepM/ murein hydrolase activator NlpD